MRSERYHRLKDWWATAQSSVVTHRRMKWFWVALTIVAWITNLVDSVRFVSMLSLVALILGSWSAEEAATVAVKQEEAEETTGT